MRLSLILSVLLSSAVAIGAAPIMGRWNQNDAGGNKDRKRDLVYHPLPREGPLIVAAREADSMNDSPNLSDLHNTEDVKRDGIDVRDTPTTDGDLFVGDIP